MNQLILSAQILYKVKKSFNIEILKKKFYHE